MRFVAPANQTGSRSASTKKTMRELCEDTVVRGMVVSDWIQCFKGGEYRDALRQFEELAAHPTEHFTQMFGNLFTPQPKDTMMLRKLGYTMPLVDLVPKGGSVLVFSTYMGHLKDSVFCDYRHLWSKVPVTYDDLEAMQIDVSDDMLTDANVCFAISWTDTPDREQWELSRFVCMVSVARVYDYAKNMLGRDGKMMYVPAPFDTLGFSD